MSDDWSLDARFVEAVHASLKRLRRDQALSRHPLTELAAVQVRCQRNGWPNTPLGRAAALRGTLAQALQTLAGKDVAAADLLEHRFWHGETAARLARERHVAESTLYEHQRRALHTLARILWSMEQDARRNADTRASRLVRNLPFPSYRRLFGREDMLARLRAELTDPEGPSLVCLEGLGGLGKTALAHRFATWAAGASAFSDIGWVTAQRRHFTIWRGMVGDPGDSPGLTLASILDGIALQLQCDHVRGRSVSQKKAVLRTMLREASYLVVVDSLETASDRHAFAHELLGLADPTRFLFTSCRSLGGHPQVTCLTLEELSEADSVRLARFEGAELGIRTIASSDDPEIRQIYEVTGGHPLAIKLVVGQARSLPLNRALHRLREARGQRSEDLYRFIYQQSWDLLSQAARGVLVAMASLPASGACWEDLLAVAGLPEDRLDRAVQKLAGMSLLNVGGVEKKWYAIHQLTRTFLTSGVLRRWSSEEDGLAGGGTNLAASAR